MEIQPLLALDHPPRRFRASVYSQDSQAFIWASLTLVPPELDFPIKRRMQHLQWCAFPIDLALSSSDAHRQ